MAKEKTRVVVIGAGRLGSALVWQLKHLGYDVAGVFDRAPGARRIGGDRYRIEGMDGIKENMGLLKPDVVVFTVPDREVKRVFLRVRRYLKKGALVVHCCGAWGKGLFADAESYGLETLVLHPIKSFVNVRQAIADLPGSYFSLNGSPAGLRWGRRLVRQLKGRVIIIPESQRALYHAMCVFGSNFLNALFDGVERIGQQLGLPSRRAREIVLPLTLGVLENIRRQGAVRALSGPVKRGDRLTVARHYKSLRRCLPELAVLYQQLSRYLAKMGGNR